MPLAIEMAASHVRTMTLSEISTSLNDRFALLMRGRRTALPRHRTLRATIEWSYRLLSEPERTLLARLAVFADGCCVDAAEAVCTDATLRANDILTLLIQLADKSLVVADTRGEQTRYRLLETVRQFAAERLRESGEADQAYQQHVGFLLKISRLMFSAKGAERLVLYKRIEAELGNARALLAWARTTPDKGEAMLRLAAAWRSSWWLHNFHLAEGVVWLQEALSRDQGAPVDARIEALAVMNELANLIRSIDEDISGGYDVTKCQTLADEVYQLSIQAGDCTHAADALSTLATLSDEHECSLALYEQAWQLIDKPPTGCGLDSRNSITRITLLRKMASEWLAQGNHARALPLFEQSFKLSLEEDYLAGIAMSVVPLFSVDATLAIMRFEQALAFQRQQGSPEGVAAVTHWLGGLLGRAGNYARAQVLLEESLTQWRALGVRSSLLGGTATVIDDLGYVAWLCRDFDAALARYEELRQLFCDAGDTAGVAWSHYKFGKMLLDKGEPTNAALHLRQHLTLLSECKTRLDPWLCISLATLAHLAHVQGSHLHAATLYGATIRFRSVANPRLKNWHQFCTYVWPMLEHDLTALHTYGGNELADPILVSARIEGELMTPQQVLDFALHEP
jgi:tetratricopeptide (TPR) repeat protein